MANTNTATVTKIDITVLTGNLFPDTDGIDRVASGANYRNELESRLSAEYPDAEVTVTLQNAEGHNRSPYVEIDGENVDLEENTKRQINHIQEKLYNESSWWVDAQ